MRTLQAQQVHVNEVSHTPFVFKRLLDQLKRCPERENPLNRVRWSNFDIIIGYVSDVPRAG